MRRRRVPGLTTKLNVVPLVELLALLITHRPAAIRLARSIVGDADAEDCVSEVGLYLLEKREYLRSVPGPSLFYTAVRHAALRLRRSSWHRRVVKMDPRDLVIAEQAMVAGRSSEHRVRLPESVG